MSQIHSDGSQRQTFVRAATRSTSLRHCELALGIELGWIIGLTLQQALEELYELLVHDYAEIRYKD